MLREGKGEESRKNALHSEDIRRYQEHGWSRHEAKTKTVIKLVLNPYIAKDRMVEALCNGVEDKLIDSLFQDVAWREPLGGPQNRHRPPARFQ